MSNEIKDNLTQQSTWLRGLYMLLFALFYSIAEIVLFAVVIFQFLLKLFTAESNARLLKLGQSLATYIYQIIQFLTFNSDYQPYPFGAWPKSEPAALKKQRIESDETES
ncbi:MAG: DUF4389 domain-containing protein [Gammaproteobacteria bacterium]|nr:DUF4389 domain-containing protein [Gammaproteobacteria bacterium]